MSKLMIPANVIQQIKDIKKDKSSQDTSTDKSNKYIFKTFKESYGNILNKYNNRYFDDNFVKEYFRIINDDERIIDKKENSKMEDGYKKLIDRLDQDMRDHKKEIRDRDDRLYNEMKERELRLHNEMKEREEHILSAISNISKDIKDTEQHVRTMVTQNFWGRIGSIIAILAICATVGATIWAAFKSL